MNFLWQLSSPVLVYFTDHGRRVVDPRTWNVPDRLQRSFSLLFALLIPLWTGTGCLFGIVPNPTDTNNPPVRTASPR